MTATMNFEGDTRVDLHVHSSASDGELEPAAVVEAAAAAGLAAVALADHDTTAGVGPALRAAEALDIAIVPAVELSTTWHGSELHILGYWIDPAEPRLVAHAESAVLRRRERVVEIIERLRALGVELAYDDVVAAAGGDRGLGRPHVARALVDAGRVRSVSEAFDRWLADDGPAFVPTRLLEPEAAFGLIHGAGGVAVWAHPPMEGLRRDLDTFVEAGLDGVECYRPRVDANDAARIERAAARHRLMLGGGSDWHGSWSGPIGAFAVQASRVRALLEAGHAGRSDPAADALPPTSAPQAPQSSA